MQILDVLIQGERYWVVGVGGVAIPDGDPSAFDAILGQAFDWSLRDGFVTARSADEISVAIAPLVLVEHSREDLLDELRLEEMRGILHLLDAHRHDLEWLIQTYHELEPSIAPPHRAAMSRLYQAVQFVLDPPPSIELDDYETVMLAYVAWIQRHHLMPQPVFIGKVVTD